MKTLGKPWIALAAILVLATGCASRKPIPTADSLPTHHGDVLTPTNRDTVGGIAYSGAFKPDERWIATANWTQLPKIYFDYDRAIIRESERAKMQQIADYLMANPSQGVLVAGHCDERGTAEYNRALGQRRADAAREYLARLGVNPDRIATISYGKDRPAVIGHNEWAWSQNRRAEFGVGSLGPSPMSLGR
jgi:peptidoglycan-associated lipoprotein